MDGGGGGVVQLSNIVVSVELVCSASSPTCQETRGSPRTYWPADFSAGDCPPREGEFRESDVCERKRERVER